MNEHEGHDHDLRDKITKAIGNGTPQWSPTVFVAEEAANVADALMPVVREALAQAWDDGWVRGFSDDDYGESPNPWREDD